MEYLIERLPRVEMGEQCPKTVVWVNWSNGFCDPVVHGGNITVGARGFGDNRYVFQKLALMLCLRPESRGL